jgi:hypothetical protein
LRVKKNLHTGLQGNGADTSNLHPEHIRYFFRREPDDVRPLCPNRGRQLAVVDPIRTSYRRYNVASGFDPEGNCLEQAFEREE